MTRKVYEVDPMVCPRCVGTMKVVAFGTDYGAIDWIIDYGSLSEFPLKLTTESRGAYIYN